jgi:hypothetical protein
MNTFKTDFKNEQGIIKHLFQQLFSIQIQLKKYNDARFHFHKEVKALIKVIDRLMQLLLSMYFDV